MINNTNFKKEFQYEYDINYENDNDIDTEYMHDTYEDPIDIFISNYTDTIIDLYYEIMNQFPYVLNSMNSSHLMSFIIHHNYHTQNYNYNRRSNKKKFDIFESEFKIEIIESLKSINKYSYNPYHSITYDDWLYFLYSFASI